MQNDRTDELLGLLNQISMAEEANAGSEMLTGLLNQLHQASADPMAAQLLASMEEENRRMAVDNIDKATPIELLAIKELQAPADAELTNTVAGSGRSMSPSGPIQGYQWDSAKGDYVRSTDGTVTPVGQKQGNVYSDKDSKPRAQTMADGSAITGARTLADGTVQPFSYASRETVQARALSGNMQKQMQTILSMGSLDDSMTAYADLQTAMATQAQAILRDLTAQAEQKLGVDRLRNLLQQREAADRNRPDWWKTQTYSQDTELVRQQYEQAVVKAEALGSKWAQSNPELISMSNQAKLFEWQLRKKESTAQSIEAKKASAVDKQQDKLETERMKWRPEQLENMRIAFAGQWDESELTDEAILAKLANGKKTLTKEEEAVFKMTEQELAAPAILQASPLASKLFAERTAQRAGKSTTEVLQKMNQVRNRMDPTYLIQANGWTADSPEAKQLQASFAAIKSGVATDKEKLEIQQRLYAGAVQSMQVQNTREKLNNLDQWAMPEGRIKDVYEGLKASGRSSVTMEDLAMYLVGSAKKEELADLATQIKDIVQMNLSANKGDPLFGSDPMLAYSVVDRAMAAGIRTNAFNILYDTVDKATSKLDPYTPIGATTALGQSISGAWTEFWK
jgi:hypothetical protein